jgi:Amt family ammonium transporter
MSQNHTTKKALISLIIWGMGSGLLQAQETAVATVDSGNSAWIFTATALVLFMTMPGLALFYGGLVRGKNFLSVLGQCAGIAFVASLLWVAGLYSLAFKGDGKWIGDLSAAFLHGIGTDAVAANTSIPELLFVMFQMTFAIITPALYIGAVVERMKFSAVMLFSALWLALVYTPVTKWVWGGGWLLAP